MVKDVLERQRRKSSPYLRRLVASKEEYILCPYSPHSWWHELGRSKMVKRLEAKGFPSLFGWHFVTLTIDPDLFDGPEQAYEKGCARLRKLVFWLREKGYNIERSFWKFELTQAGWPHWHMGWDCRGFIDNEDVTELWALGFTKIKRVKKRRDFKYLFKYVVKDVGDGSEIPDWVLDRKKTIRVFQTSAGFYGETSKPAKPSTEPKAKREPIGNTLREKFATWRRRALIRGRSMGYFGQAVFLNCTFTEIFIAQAENGQRPLDMYHMPISIKVIQEYIKHGNSNPASTCQESAHYLRADGRIEKDLALVTA